MSLSSSFTEMITNIDLANSIEEIFTFLKSSKGKDANIYKGYYYLISIEVTRTVPIKRAVYSIKITREINKNAVQS